MTIENKGINMFDLVKGIILDRMEKLGTLKGSFSKSEWEAHKQGTTNTIDKLCDDLLDKDGLSSEEYQVIDDLLDTLADMAY